MTGIFDRTVKVRRAIQEIVLANKTDTLTRQFIADQVAEKTGHRVKGPSISKHLKEMGIPLATTKNSKKFGVILDALKETKGQISNGEIQSKLIDSGFKDVPESTLAYWVRTLRRDYEIMSGQVAVQWEKELLVKTVTEAIAEMKEVGVVDPKPGVMLHYLAKNKDTYISAYILSETMKTIVTRKEQTND